MTDPREETLRRLLDTIARISPGTTNERIEAVWDDVNAALISAVIQNQPRMVRLLLDAGASPRYRERLFGRTAFDYVGDATHPSVLDMLRSVRDNPAHTDEGNEEVIRRKL